MLAMIDDQHKPAIRVAEVDYERLTNLAGSADTEGAELLRAELQRARVVSDAQLAAEPGFVRLGSAVEYRDLLSGRVRRVEVTTPDAADIDRGRLSVRSPVGAALIGLSAGDTFCWTGDGDRPRILLVHWVGAPAAIEEVG
jgi:regulator of nucleoside diphosphate kinase